MNVEMPCICHYAEQIPKAIEDGTLAMEDVDEAVGYILRTVLYYETRKRSAGIYRRYSCMPGTYSSSKESSRRIDGTSEE